LPGLVLSMEGLGVTLGTATDLAKCDGSVFSLALYLALPHALTLRCLPWQRSTADYLSGAKRQPPSGIDGLPIG
jgi:hypothetical protein